MPRMTLALNKDNRAQAIVSIERYFEQELDQRIGNIAAGALLGFFMEEIAPLIYNQAVTDAQERIQTRLEELQTRVSELDIEVREEPFQYWAARRRG
jgi:uncharacterized protein (DUF2164 family)